MSATPNTIQQKGLLFLNMFPTDLFFVYLLFLVLPFSRRIYLLGVGINPFYFIGLIGLCLFLLRRVFSDQKLIPEHPLFPYVAMVVVVLFVSILQSRFIPENAHIIRDSLLNYPFIRSFLRVIFLTSLMGISVYIFSTLTTKEKLEKAINFLLYSTTIVCLLLLVAYFLKVFLADITFLNPFLTIHFERGIRINGFFTEPGILAAFLLVTLPLTVTMCWLTSQKRYILMLLIQTIVFVLTFSRGAFLALFFGVILTLFLFVYRKMPKHFFKHYSLTKKKIFIFFSLLFMVLFLLGFFAVASQPFIAQNPQTSWSLKNRIFTTEYALEAFSDHPFMGVGYGNFIFHTGLIYNKDLYHKPFAPYPDVNNLFLQPFVETGIIGAFFFLLLFCTLSSQLMKSIFSSNTFVSTLSWSVFFTFVSLLLLTQFFTLNHFLFPWMWGGIFLRSVYFEYIESDNSRKNT
jgi:O-antigen ligase